MSSDQRLPAQPPPPRRRKTHDAAEKERKLCSACEATLLGDGTERRRREQHQGLRAIQPAAFYVGVRRQPKIRKKRLCESAGIELRQDSYPVYAHGTHQVQVNERQRAARLPRLQTRFAQGVRDWASNVPRPMAGVRR
jgi:hypothetical protein